ncbi:hypothetical protein AUK40_02495 [Candidatus Wirthbacteria bacterium CG2_30_54_11]|uniref:Plasmid stabilization protein n=1 Tax=Candidatus Wirthbacteria bacterium CG2_30_54_11 TaxID=1817892 RepID=A0A1J5J2Q8_9BACT|nr:MAG: hypothetical protein AUK40_02495 [Candidatus Wirthbacteria bacterium CG2_30_54_11]
MYRIFFYNHTDEVLYSLDERTQDQIIGALEQLALDPFAMAQVKKIAGTRDGYRLRVGRWRVIYLTITEDQIINILSLFMERSTRDYARIIERLVKMGVVRRK